MITLSKKLKEERSSPAHKKPVAAVEGNRRVSIRDKLLVKEVPEMETNLPASCKLHFEDHNNLHNFQVLVSPDEGFWRGGKFRFDVHVPEEYNMMPPKVTCSTRIWHPNITEDGKICLSLLREHSVDGTGWAPTRRLKDVIWGLDSLFTDLLNFDDPLNIEAAEHYLRDKKDFEAKVRYFVDRYARIIPTLVT